MFSRHHVSEKSIDRARALRKDATMPERSLWNALRIIPKELGITFRRQHPIGPFIADFACLKLKLVVELDGQSHDTQLAYDVRRDQYLSALGYKTVRFTNDDVNENLEGVYETILCECQERHERSGEGSAVGHPPPQPLPPKGGGAT